MSRGGMKTSAHFGDQIVYAYSVFSTTGLSKKGRPQPREKARAPATTSGMKTTKIETKSMSGVTSVKYSGLTMYNRMCCNKSGCIP